VSDKDRRDEDREKRARDEEDERRAETERRGEQLKEAWRQRHPREERDSPRGGRS
jgi:type II secretory pathway component PulM